MLYIRYVDTAPIIIIALPSVDALRVACNSRTDETGAARLIDATSRRFRL